MVSRITTDHRYLDSDEVSHINTRRWHSSSLYLSTEGNLVHTLNDQNPSRLILSALQKTGSASSGGVDIGIKDDEFFLGVFRYGKVRQTSFPGGDIE